MLRGLSEMNMCRRLRTMRVAKSIQLFLSFVPCFFPLCPVNVLVIIMAINTVVVRTVGCDRKSAETGVGITPSYLISLALSVLIG